jgi:hypothetical protein
MAITELEARGFFHKLGRKQTAPVAYFQSIDEFIAGLHSRSGLTRERVGEQKAEEFDRQVRTLLLRFHQDQILPLQVVGLVMWGTPGAGSRE